MTDPFDLARFVAAQSPVVDQVLADLRAGRKRTHWMWFVFPQIAGLGQSAMARRYAIASLAEARSYLAHPVLGARLETCAALVTAVRGRSALEVFGAPDDAKFRSSMTLFKHAGGKAVFGEALARYFGGEEDQATVERLA